MYVIETNSLCYLYFVTMTQEVELGSTRKHNVFPEDIQNVQNVNIIIDDDDNACVICLESLDEEQSIHFHCEHVFHIHCILEWIYSLFDKNVDISCPVCRSIECKASSPYYNVLKVYVGYNQPIKHSYSIEAQTRLQNNVVDTQSSQQRIYQSNQQATDEGLRKGFFRFMMCFTFLMVCFFCFLIYSIKRK